MNANAAEAELALAQDTAAVRVADKDGIILTALASGVSQAVILRGIAVVPDCVLS